MPTAKLRQDTVRSLPYMGQNNSQCIYWDETLKGFGLRVFGCGRRTFVCAYRLYRCRRIATLGRADVLTLDQARRKAVRYLGQAADNAEPQTQSDAEAASVTVAELVDQYLEKHAKPKKRSWKLDQGMPNTHLSSFGSRPAISVTTAQIERIYAAYCVGHPYNREIANIRPRLVVHIHSLPRDVNKRLERRMPRQKRSNHLRISK